MSGAKASTRKNSAKPTTEPVQVMDAIEPDTHEAKMTVQAVIDAYPACKDYMVTASDMGEDGTAYDPLVHQHLLSYAYDHQMNADGKYPMANKGWALPRVQEIFMRKLIDGGVLPECDEDTEVESYKDLSANAKNCLFKYQKVSWNITMMDFPTFDEVSDGFVKMGVYGLVQAYYKGQCYLVCMTEVENGPAFEIPSYRGGAVNAKVGSDLNLKATLACNDTEVIKMVVGKTFGFYHYWNKVRKANQSAVENVVATLEKLPQNDQVKVLLRSAKAQLRMKDRDGKPTCTPEREEVDVVRTTTVTATREERKKVSTDWTKFFA